MADNEIPLSEDYDFSDLTNEELAREIEITQAIMDQIDRMVAENETKITQGDDVDGRERMITILTAEKGFKTDKMTALIAEQERRES